MSEPMNQATAGRELVDVEAQLDLLAARRGVLLAPIDAQIAALNARRSALRAALPGMMQSTASTGLSLVDDDGAKLGRVTLSAGAWKAAVTDEAKLTAWVADRYPTEVETVTVVRAAFLTKLQTEAKRAKNPVDCETGELIPGLAVEQGGSYVATTPTDAARARAAEVLGIPVKPEELVTA